jgi:hypothetical protein
VKTPEASHDSLAVRQDGAVRTALEGAGIEFTPGIRPV